MKLLILRCSLNSSSKSALMAHYVHETLKSINQDVHVEFLDIRTLNLPMCDGESVYTHPGVLQLKEAVSAADGILIATPVYNYNMAGSTKNCIDLINTWHGKTIAFVTATGGSNSYMALNACMSSLVLSYRTFILPRFVQASAVAFKDNQIIDASICERLKALAQEWLQFTQVLKPLAGLYSKAD